MSNSITTKQVYDHLALITLVQHPKHGNMDYVNMN